MRHERIREIGHNMVEIVKSLYKENVHEILIRGTISEGFRIHKGAKKLNKLRNPYKSTGYRRN